jgi:hypothetical protein
MRFGVVDKLDIQLVVDPSILPEVSIGYQLVGEQPGDFALTLTAGAKPMIFGGGGAAAGIIHLPIGVLVDIPLGDESALFAGVTTPLQVIFGAGGGTGGAAINIEPTLNAGLSLKVGSLVLQPEIAIAQNIFLFDSAGAGTPTPLFIQYAVGLGIGGRFGGPAPAPASPSGPAPAPGGGASY